MCVLAPAHAGSVCSCDAHRVRFSELADTITKGLRPVLIPIYEVG